jgi:cyanophycin synthetase
MFAAAMAHAMGVSLDNIRQGLRTFDTSFFQVPGRMNIFDKLGFKVILDYGHNPAAVQAMSSLVDGLSTTGVLAKGGKRVCVVAAPGDRRDEDIRKIAEIVSKSFDVFICREDDRKRGREHGAVAQILRDTLCAEGISEDAVHMIPFEVDAVDTALGLCSPGDLLLIFADKITRSWKQIIYHHSAESKSKVETEISPVLDEEEISVGGSPFVQDERGVFLPHEEQAD